MIYLDNAATSFPKPACVHEAMDRFARENGASPRGRFGSAREAAGLVRECRERINRLINGESADQVVFTLNTTDALNLAIHGVIGHRRRAVPRRGVHVITTGLDHNSVLRPYSALGEDGVEQTRVEVDRATGVVDPEDVRRAIRAETALVAVNHASNVPGAIQPVEPIGRVCRELGVP